MQMRSVRCFVFFWAFVAGVHSRKLSDDTVFKFEYEPRNAAEKEKSVSLSCGYESCDLGQPGMINVHLVPHTHDDVGWLVTVDEYYYSDVQYILDNVNLYLEGDEKKRFIYVEMAFFYRWWNELTELKKTKVKNLVNQGRLEFILGGWSMNDEAATHYSAIIDQHTLGFDFLKQNFGECGVPKIGWQIDPFGHSREQASIFAQFGFDGLFFARIDYQDYEKRKNTKTLESVWFGSDSLEDRSSLFTGALYGMSYSEPGGYCFEYGDEPIKDRSDLDDFNVDQRVSKFLKDAKSQADSLATNHIMWTMGSDFHYKNAAINFKNIDKLIKYVNKKQADGSNVNVLYSTPSCYLYALNKANITWTSKTDDFFPYAHRPHTFWTGYFTSRATLKGYERSSNNVLQVCKQLDVLGLVAINQTAYSKVDVLRQAMGVVQHHDGVSGTSKQHVAFNYAKMLSEGVGQCQDVMQMSLKNLLLKKSSLRYGTVDDIKFCNLLNVSSCFFTEITTNFAVIVYNPFGQSVDTNIRVPVARDNYKVVDSSLSPVDVQLVPLSEETKRLPERFNSFSVYDLVVPVSLPPLGYSTYFVSLSHNIGNRQRSQSRVAMVKSDIVVENEYLRLVFNPSNGLLQTIENLKSGIKANITQRLLYYVSMTGNNAVPNNQSSGAYIFRPNGSVYPIGKADIKVIEGLLVTEVRQIFSNYASQVIRLYKKAKYFEVEWTVGPLPAEHGTEIVSSFETTLDSKDVFYTDANGRQMMKRVRDFRPTWNLQQTEPIAGNYYPVNSRIFIRDFSKNMQLTVLTDRSQGGASLRSGQLELMLHRRLFCDDSLGVEEPLNEPGVDKKPLIVRGIHKVIFDTIEASTQLHRSLAQQTYMAPYYGFIKLSQSPQEFVEQYNVKWSGLKMELPKNVHLLTLEEWHSGSVLLRLEHFYEKNEDQELSKTAKVSLKDLFSPLKIKSVEELTLGANRELSQAKRLVWDVKGYGKTIKDMNKYVVPVDPETLEVELKPMQIRTLLIKI